MSIKMADRVTRAINNLKQFCKSQKVEININADGYLAIWAELDKTDITIDGLKPDEVVPAVMALQVARKCGWKSV